MKGGFVGTSVVYLDKYDFFFEKGPSHRAVRGDTEYMVKSSASSIVPKPARKLKVNDVVVDPATRQTTMVTMIEPVSMKVHELWTFGKGVSFVFSPNDMSKVIAIERQFTDIPLALNMGGYANLVSMSRARADCLRVDLRGGDYFIAAADQEVLLESPSLTLLTYSRTNFNRFTEIQELRPGFTIQGRDRMFITQGYPTAVNYPMDVYTLRIQVRMEYRRTDTDVTDFIVVDGVIARCECIA